MSNDAELASRLQRRRTSTNSKFANYKPSFRRRSYMLFLKVAFKLTMRLEILDMENLPSNIGYIAMINHISFLDPVLVSGTFPGNVISLAKIEAYEHWFTGRYIQAFDAIPVKRGSVDRVTLRTAFEVLDNGLPLLIAPEGTRSDTGGLGEPHQGLAYIASRANVPIVPVAISGSSDWQHNVRRFKRTWVRMRIGEPFYLDSGQRRANTAVLKEMSNEAMYRMAAVLPPEQRGIYSNLDTATAQYIRVMDEEKR